MRSQDVGKERLIHPGAPDGAASITNDRVENLETTAPRDGDVCAFDLTEHCRPHSGTQRGDRLHVAAVFVPERKAVQEIFDRDETGAFEVRGLARTDAFLKLDRSVEKVVQLLDDHSLPGTDIDLPNRCGKRKRIFQVHAPRVVRRT